MVQKVHGSEISNDIEILDDILQHWVKTLKHADLSLELVDYWHLISDHMNPVGDSLGGGFTPGWFLLIKFSSQLGLLSLLHHAVLEQLEGIPEFKNLLLSIAPLIFGVSSVGQL